MEHIMTVPKAGTPPRRWALVGYQTSGKSTFATQMRQELMLIDADNRFEQVSRFAVGEIRAIADPAARTDPKRINEIMLAAMPLLGDVQTIVVDSVTSIIQPIIAHASAQVDAKEIKLPELARRKANAMTLIKTAVSRWNLDTLWVWHLNAGRGHGGDKQVTETVSRVERDRMRAVLNAELLMVQDNGKHGIKVRWSRGGRAGYTLYDHSGHWAGMPEAIDHAMYTNFSGEDEAIRWAVDNHGYTEDEARRFYNEVKAARKPKAAGAMWLYWTMAVLEIEQADAPQAEAHPRHTQ